MNTAQLPLPLLRIPAPPRRQAPVARRSDPETSHQAGEEVTASGERERQCAMVLDFLRARPGLTSAELARTYGADRYLVARRLPELRFAGLAHNGTGTVRPDKRQCSVTGRLAILWWPA